MPYERGMRLVGRLENGAKQQDLVVEEEGEGGTKRSTTTKSFAKTFGMDVPSIRWMRRKRGMPKRVEMRQLLSSGLRPSGELRMENGSRMRPQGDRRPDDRTELFLSR